MVWIKGKKRISFSQLTRSRACTEVTEQSSPQF
jgi:hypothetical protein